MAIFQDDRIAVLGVSDRQSFPTRKMFAPFGAEAGGDGVGSGPDYLGNYIPNYTNPQTPKEAKPLLFLLGTGWHLYSTFCLTCWLRSEICPSVAW